MYTEKHSIYFSDTHEADKNGVLIGQNTWTNWHLIPTIRPSVAAPQFSPKLVEIPGRTTGSIDVSNNLTGVPFYGSRTGSWDFYVDNGHEEWTQIFHNLQSSLHGKRKYCMLDDDIGYYYVGRLTVGNWNSDKSYSKISIGYTLEPYKRFTGEAGDFLWDPFNFETDRTDQTTAKSM